VKEYAEYDGLGLADLVAKREVDPSELVEAAITRIEALNPELNAVIYKAYDVARAAARAPAPAEPGPFHGVPMVLKDLLALTPDMPTTLGSRLLPAEPSPIESTLVTRYKRAGLIPLAKTNAPEFGIVATTEPLRYGPTRNPWNREHSPGGSSGGSAAAVASGMVPIGHANDGGGSIRIPASCCGLVGLKPTRGRNPLGPMIGDALAGLAAEHVVTRSVRDTAAVLDCTAGPEPGDPYAAPAPERPYREEVGRDPGPLRIGFSTGEDLGFPVDAECKRGVEETARLLESLGHRVEATSPPITRGAIDDAFLTLWAAGCAMQVHVLSGGRPPRETEIEPLTAALAERGGALSAIEWQLAVATMQAESRRIAHFFEDHDAWLTPTLASPPVRLGVIDGNESDLDRGFAPMIDYVPFTPFFNMTGQPAISLPLAWSEGGLPIGMHFAGRFGDEGGLIRLAAQLENAKPWAARRPDGYS
jgi:amidase